MKNVKESNNTKQLSFDFKSEDNLGKKQSNQGRIISIFTQNNSKVSFQNKVFKDVIKHSKSF